MLRTFLKAKIHRATVTETDLDYEGSLTMDPLLLEASGIAPFEQVDVYNITSGSRFTTYAIEGIKGEGEIKVNGAAAHHANKGDLVIIASYVILTDEEVANHVPKVIIVNEHNLQFENAE
ncbi:aspartate 1-decarboxylase [bacterium]|nr:aspartate 1-decarboxylase [bacterium]